ncbi:hypothetical protein LCGC14_2345930, partial [marine sediment metagenome]
IILSFGKEVKNLTINSYDYRLADENGEDEGNLELKEKNYERSDGDFISYTELWYQSKPRGYSSKTESHILRRIKGRSLNLKEWFDNIYSKWIEYNKELKSPL